MPNREHAQKTLELIDAHQSALRMSYWAGWQVPADAAERPDDREPITSETIGEECGTTACLAGFATLAAGNVIKRVPEPANAGCCADGHFSIEAFTPDGGRLTNSYTDTDSWFKHGAELLGLPPGDADALFVASEERGLAVLRDIANGDDYQDSLYEYDD